MDRFPSLTSMKKAAIKLHVQILCAHVFLFFLGVYLEMLGLPVALCVGSEAQLDRFPNTVHCVTFPWALPSPEHL